MREFNVDMTIELVRWIQNRNHRAYLSHRRKKLMDINNVVPSWQRCLLAWHYSVCWAFIVQLWSCGLKISYLPKGLRWPERVNAPADKVQDLLLALGKIVHVPPDLLSLDIYMSFDSIPESCCQEGES